MTTDEQLAAIRDRHAKYGYGFDPKYDKADIAALLARIDTLTAERNYLEQNETVVWEVLQLPDGSTIHDVAAAVFKLRQERDTLTAERDEAEANIGEVNQLLADTLSLTKIAEQQAERLTAELAAAQARADGERATVVAWLARDADRMETESLPNLRGHAYLDATATINTLRCIADAIERGEYKEKPNAKPE